MHLSPQSTHSELEKSKTTNIDALMCLAKGLRQAQHHLCSLHYHYLEWPKPPRNKFVRDIHWRVL